ncbi:hypothetical protein [Haloarcula amylovorans]|uniref:hypothetical protein n=1 Tax=Haloarcula amylovorans TaxID=2562280 RepID=UPI00107608BF|nr:hypothetical protein [Halomicroarcula amylolytica]
MKESAVEDGVEVTHPKYGRGVVTEYRPNFGAEPDDIVVDFHALDDCRTLPVYAVEAAQKVTTANVEPGRFGFTAVVDDGVGTLIVQPDGTGDGYAIELLIDGESIDQTTVSRVDGTASQ